MSGPGKLIFIRHAETAMAGTFCGQTDPPLNQAGLDHLPHLVETMREHAIRRVSSSDLQRAKATAQALADEFVTPLDTNTNLREIGFGDWEGLSWSQIEERDQAFAQQWIAQYPNRCAPNGESYANFRSRVMSCIDDLMRCGEGNVAVVTHAGVLQLVLITYCGHTAQQAWEMTRAYGSFFTLDRPTI